MMMELLKRLSNNLSVNQLQLSAAFTPSFEAGFHVNMEGPKAAVRDGSVFEYCRLTDTVIQAWSSSSMVISGEFCRQGRVCGPQSRPY